MTSARAPARESFLRLSISLALIAGVASDPLAAHAQETPKRPVPDYSGLPAPNPSVGEVALWVPRVLLFPLYVVSEYVLRRPIGALITTAERNNWATTLQNFFTFGPDHSAGIIPTAFFDFGLRPSVGVYFFWDRAFAPANAVRAHVSYFGSDWLAASLSDRVRLDSSSIIALDAAFLHRPDNVYAGEGARSTKAGQARFLDDRLSLTQSLDTRAHRLLLLREEVGVRHDSFNGSTFGADGSVDQAVAAGRYPFPVGYQAGFTTVFERLQVALDTREKVGGKSGVRLTAFGQYGTDVKNQPGASWVKYGATAGGYVDLWKSRVLSLNTTIELADPIRGQIPFTEEVVWGGPEPMSGYLPGRLRGRSAAAAQVIYSWPVWVWLDGAIRTTVGNVFDPELRDFSPKLLRLDTGVGVQSSGSPDHRFEVFFGVGSETFEQGGRIDSVRIFAGGTNGFLSTGSLALDRHAGIGLFDGSATISVSRTYGTRH